MKKRLLFYFSFVTFMIFSFTRCSQDFLETSDESENFAREARLYFEQNASGIQNVSIGDQKTVLSRNMNLSSAVIVPRWEKQEYFKKGDISTLEVPLDGNVFTQSLYTTKTQNGVSVRTLSNVSTKLVIQKHERANELRYFIVTIINREQANPFTSSQETHPIGYIHHPELEGLMIFSDIEGNYLDAFLYSKGVKQRVALAKAAGMDASSIDPEHVVGAISMSATSNPGIYSRAGESGGGEKGCWLCGDPKCKGDCEVLVTYCKKCNRSISTCICCSICHNYPCSCYTPPVWRCPKCGSSLCPGDCTSSGGGGVPPSTTVSPQGDLSKKIFSNDSKLTKEQWQKVEEVLNNINNDCMGGKMFKDMINSSIKLIYDKNLSPNGQYNAADKTLKIKQFDKQNELEIAVLHELFHSQQPLNLQGKLNMEIEAHFMMYRYIYRNRIQTGTDPILKVMAGISGEFDAQYNYIGDDFNGTYNYLIETLRKNSTYNEKDYPESSSSRNFNTARKFSSDCIE